LSFNTADMVGVSGVVAPKVDLTTGAFSGHALFISASADNADG
jgi:hypothetical protein